MDSTSSFGWRAEPYNPARANVAAGAAWPVAFKGATTRLPYHDAKDAAQEATLSFLARSDQQRQWCTPSWTWRSGFLAANKLGRKLRSSQLHLDELQDAGGMDRTEGEILKRLRTSEEIAVDNLTIAEVAKGFTPPELEYLRGGCSLEELELLQGPSKVRLQRGKQRARANRLDPTVPPVTAATFGLDFLDRPPAPSAVRTAALAELARFDYGDAEAIVESLSTTGTFDGVLLWKARVAYVLLDAARGYSAQTAPSELRALNPPGNADRRWRIAVTGALVLDLPEDLRAEAHVVALTGSLLPDHRVAAHHRGELFFAEHFGIAS